MAEKIIFYFVNLITPLWHFKFITRTSHNLVSDALNFWISQPWAPSDNNRAKDTEKSVSLSALHTSGSAK